MTLASFQSRFSTHEACRAHLEALRWPNGVVCARCGVVGEAKRLSTRPDIWRCRSCKGDFRVTDGTPMEGTHLKLNVWFLALYLVATSSKGVSAMKLKDWLGVSYKTAWFLGHRVRQMLADGSAGRLAGIIEADEPYVGGVKRKGRDDDEDGSGRPSHRGRGRARSTVFVAVERGGKAKAKRVASHGVAAPLWQWSNVKGSVLMADGLPAYRWIGRKFAGHLTADHKRQAYARTDRRRGIRVHTNTAESFNSAFKRAIVGVWH